MTMKHCISAGNQQLESRATQHIGAVIDEMLGEKLSLFGGLTDEQRQQIARQMQQSTRRQADAFARQNSRRRQATAKPTTLGEAVAQASFTESSLWPNTEFDVVLKLLTLEPGRMPVGVQKIGTLVHDGGEDEIEGDHYTFVEWEGPIPNDGGYPYGGYLNGNPNGGGNPYGSNPYVGTPNGGITPNGSGKPKPKRNERVWVGKYVTLTHRPADGHVRLNFREIHFASDFDIAKFAVDVCMEIVRALVLAKGLIGEKPAPKPVMPDLGE